MRSRSLWSRSMRWPGAIAPLNMIAPASRASASCPLETCFNVCSGTSSSGGRACGRDVRRHAAKQLRLLRLNLRELSFEEGERAAARRDRIAWPADRKQQDRGLEAAAVGD